MRRNVVIFLMLGIALSGCQSGTRLIATPTVSLGDRGRAAFDAIPEDQRTPTMHILYAGDRASVDESAFGSSYGFGRSSDLIFGVASVGFMPEMTWDQLVANSTQARWDAPGGARPKLYLDSAVSFGRLAVSLREMQVREGRYQLSDEHKTELAESKDRLHRLLRERLSGSKTGDVFLYVHGFNNTFEDAIFRLAMMWHFAGRPGVPIAYTWPAGRGGLTGYAYDRESGEFTVFHLKLFIRALAASPDVKRIHIIGHSRGCDVVCTALRELNIESRAKNLLTQEQIKLWNLVLAAPDLDADVFEQRVAIEDLHLVAQRTTLYLSRADFALAASNWLFGGRSRVGAMSVQTLPPETRDKMRELKSFHIVDCHVKGYSTSHDYAFAHPAVVSDLILLLRDDRNPGAEHGRPLEAEFEGAWEITNDYLKGAP